jgi:hypothetical protein
MAEGTVAEGTVVEGGAGHPIVICDGTIRSGYATGGALR